MGKRTITELIDDLDGSTLGEDAESLRFAVGGRQYEIDLSKKNADKFRKALEPYVEAARPVADSARGSRANTSSQKRDLSAVRSWAASNGHEVSSRGRVPESVLSAYDAANS